MPDPLIEEYVKKFRRKILDGDFTEASGEMKNEIVESFLRTSLKEYGDKRVGQTIKIEEIRGALARGYCSKENESKVLDPELLEAMAIEIKNLLTDNT